MSYDEPNVSFHLKRLVVVADDDSRIRESLKSLFNSAAMDVRIFGSGEEAFQIFSVEAVGCLVTDIRMPGMDGGQLQQLVADAYPQLPVIFITAYQDQQAYSRALSLGAFAFFYKPFDGEELLRTAVRALACGFDSLTISLKKTTRKHF